MLAVVAPTAKLAKDISKVFAKVVNWDLTQGKGTLARQSVKSSFAASRITSLTLALIVRS